MIIIHLALPQKNLTPAVIHVTIVSGVASTGARGAECPLDSKKIVKNQEKEGKNRQKGKIMKKRPKSGGFFQMSLLTNRAGYATAYSYDTEGPYFKKPYSVATSWGMGVRKTSALLEKKKKGRNICPLGKGKKERRERKKNIKFFQRFWHIVRLKIWTPGF